MAKRYVIVGTGPAGTYAAETIRALDSEGMITLVGTEPAHSRMAIPYWISGRIPREQVLTGSPAYFRDLGVELISATATDIDLENRTLRLDSAASLPFDALLLATGSSPSRVAIPGAELPNVQNLWTLAEADRLLEGLEASTSVCLVGAGFIGGIVLNALWKRGCPTTVVEFAPQVLPRMLDAPAGELVGAWLSDRGITLRTGATVARIEAEGDRRRVHLQNGESLGVDRVILATGVRPNVSLAEGAGLAIDHGIVIDRHCATNVVGIFAAGDCAAGPDLLTGAPQVHAIQPTAVDHGRVAGANMAGRVVEYPGSLSMNILDVAGLQCVSFGNWAGDGLESQSLRNASAALSRKLVWDGDRLVGAIFTGPMSDVCMLNDVGMVKGFIQSRTAWGAWKSYLHENPADLRRPYVALGVPQRMVETTLLGLPAVGRGYRFQNVQPKPDPGPHHRVLVGTRV